MFWIRQIENVIVHLWSEKLITLLFHQVQPRVRGSICLSACCRIRVVWRQLIKDSGVFYFGNTPWV